MARAGRKRNPNAKRRGKTAAAQGRKPLEATPERLKQFEDATGRKRRNNWDDGDATPIHMLFDKRLITQEQKSAALDYAELYWHYVGNFFRQDRCVTFAKQLVGKGSIVPPAEMLDEASEERERRFKEIDDRLTGNFRTVVHKVVLDEKLPRFLKKQDPLGIEEMNILKTGLNRLVGR